MKISEILSKEHISVSIEVFPPKLGADYRKVEAAVDALSSFSPDFMSVTYGAGGTNADNTVKMASHVQNELEVTSLAHLTCVCSSAETIDKRLHELRKEGIENVLALRGDMPADPDVKLSEDFAHASDLVKRVREFGGFCIGGACYPEGHPESPSRKADLDNLKRKVDQGCEFLTTQMFFDNNVLYNFLYRARENGINVPVIAGIMPVTSGKQISRICSLSGTTLPTRFLAVVDKFGDNPRAMAQAGIAYATEQIIDLIANGVKAIHIYSMNKPEIAGSIMRNLSFVIGRQEV